MLIRQSFWREWSLQRCRNGYLMGPAMELAAAIPLQISMPSHGIFSGASHPAPRVRLLRCCSIVRFVLRKPTSAAPDFSKPNNICSFATFLRDCAKQPQLTTHPAPLNFGCQNKFAALDAIWPPARKGMRDLSPSCQTKHELQPHHAHTHTHTSDHRRQLRNREILHCRRKMFCADERLATRLVALAMRPSVGLFETRLVQISLSFRMQA